MRNFLEIKFNTLLYVFSFFLISGLIQTVDCYGKETMGADVIYNMNLNSTEQSGTVNALKNFFEALCEGKVDILAEMMDNNLQNEYRNSFNDPSYPALLRKLYGGSKLEIKRIISKGDGSFEIDAQIISQKSGPVNVHFQIDRRSNQQSYLFKSFIINSQGD